MFKVPRNDRSITWTQHAVMKMKQYALSEQRIRRVLRVPKRKEEAIVPGLVAVMQPASSTAKHQTEIWVMYKLIAKQSSVQRMALQKHLAKIKIISCWRYPGISPLRQPPPIPEDILKEIHQLV
ncbi:MAG: hypothetical protein A2939_04390 [Parcubacteria group bacterium RIFCSPLOWO2_01_FULL_48_18]|nr:MAG: hypothetical protein A3J67_03730 [Parcubacteria group bacterium RIFCSPHIGHO2_02_FULL_48_10b]OHB22622.1 MAG: hypothetical protein A2939_04390 [Parcubacteria group bacterium RIFCSPLOWO2_01_FULL_48_18]